MRFRLSRYLVVICHLLHNYSNIWVIEDALQDDSDANRELRCLFTRANVAYRIDAFRIALLM